MWDKKEEIKKKVEEEIIENINDSINLSVHIGNINYFSNAHIEHHGSRLVLQSLVYKSLIIQNSIIMALTISTTELVSGALGLVDHASGTSFTNIVFSGITQVSSDQTIFTVATSTTDPNSIVVTGIAVGVATLTVTVGTVTYTDLSGNPQTETNKVVTIAVTVTPGVTTPTSDLVVNFGTPTVKA